MWVMGLFCFVIEIVKNKLVNKQTNINVGRSFSAHDAFLE